MSSTPYAQLALNLLYVPGSLSTPHPQTSTPAHLCSIDRVFRNEAVDRTHLAEFHQVEGEGQEGTEGTGQ